MSSAKNQAGAGVETPESTAKPAGASAYAWQRLPARVLGLCGASPARVPSEQNNLCMAQLVESCGGRQTAEPARSAARFITRTLWNTGALGGASC